MRKREKDMIIDKVSNVLKVICNKALEKILKIIFRKYEKSNYLYAKIWKVIFPLITQSDLKKN